MGWHDDQQRKKDNEGMRKIREEKLEARKRAAFLVLDSEHGTLMQAARAAKADERTVKRWDAERKAKR